MPTANHPCVKVLVFGAGAMGSLVCGMLSSRHDVILVGRRGHIDAIKRNGLKITGRTETVARLHATTELPSENQDLILVSTKAYDTALAVGALERFWHTSLFLTLQNGLRNADVLAKKVDRVAAGTTSHGVTFVRDGWIHHAGLGDTYVGPFAGVSSTDVRKICGEFTACGFPATYSDDIRRNLWMKVIANAAINPITATARVENGRLLEIPQLRSLMELSCMEGAAVARAEGHRFSDREAIAVTERVAHRTAKNRSSMLQDVERGKRTEISEISGAIVETGRNHGIATPVLDTIRLVIGML